MSITTRWSRSAIPRPSTPPLTSSAWPAASLSATPAERGSEPKAGLLARERVWLDPFLRYHGCDFEVARRAVDGRQSEVPRLPHHADGADSVADAVGREAMYRRDS